MNEYDHAWRIAAAGDHPALGTCLDSFHILSVGSDLDAIAGIPAEKLFYLQLADAPHLRMEVLQWSRHHRCFPGQGASTSATSSSACSAPGTTARSRSRSSTTSSARPIPTAPPSTPCARCSCWRTSCRRALGSAASRSWSSASTASRRPRPRRCCGPWASRASARTAASRCSSGSTAPSGSCSTTAPVTRTPRWSPSPSRAPTRSGRPRARRRCSRRCSSAAGTRARPTWRPSPLPTARRCSSAERTGARLGDFLALESPSGDGVPIDRIDHITLTQPFEAFDEAALFYRSVLDLRPGPSAELAAPGGLVRSRALASRDGRVRIALNVPALAGTQRGQAELQHVAFACEDALAAARAMRERGAPILEIPGNYYDDLEARFDLDTALLDALRDLGVLYDPSGGGELLHFYSALEGRVFFEVLERRGRTTATGPSTPRRGWRHNERPHDVVEPD